MMETRLTLKLTFKGIICVQLRFPFLTRPMGGQRIQKQGVLRLLLPQNTLFLCNNHEKFVILPEINISGFVMFPSFSGDFRSFQSS
jgi:hypothetical protein